MNVNILIVLLIYLFHYDEYLYNSYNLCNYKIKICFKWSYTPKIKIKYIFSAKLYSYYYVFVFIVVWLI